MNYDDRILSILKIKNEKFGHEFFCAGSIKREQTTYEVVFRLCTKSYGSIEIMWDERIRRLYGKPSLIGSLLSVVEDSKHPRHAYKHLDHLKTLNSILDTRVAESFYETIAEYKEFIKE